MLSFYQRQLQHAVAFRAVFFTKQEFETRKEVYSHGGVLFFNPLITFSEAVRIDSSPCSLQQNVEGDEIGPGGKRCSDREE